ncbi:hypothetical protein MMC11_008783 [Xylographa trunciseda]|nr:hypothetical protein [Xylographa trunciseda]
MAGARLFESGMTIHTHDGARPKRVRDAPPDDNTPNHRIRVPGNALTHRSELCAMPDGVSLPERTMCRSCRDHYLWMFDHRSIKLPLGETSCTSSGCSLNKLLLDCLALEPSYAADSPRDSDMTMWEVDLGIVKWTPQDNEDVDPSSRARDAQELRARGWQLIMNSFQRTAIYYNVWFTQDGRRRVSSLNLAYNRNLSPRNNLFTSRPLRKQIDYSLALSWIRACDLLHRPTCTPTTWHDMGDASMRMVDVHNRCLVDITTPVVYLALSYCWGDRRAKGQLQLNASTAPDLYRSNALADDRADLPQTIRDAMLLTQRLGESFLWVDALCIFQDSDADMSAQIRYMDKIYKHAKLTVVAAAGKDAYAGLPGIREGTRAIHQISRRIGKMQFYASGGQIAFAQSLNASTWSERAWTLQEQILSPRLLLFSESEMSWNCECAIWTEGMVLECFAPGTTIELNGQFRGCVKPSQNLTPLQKFNYYVGAGSARKLTFEDDRLRCMQGLLNTLSVDFPGGFIWGMPISIFDSALLFHGVLWQQAPWQSRPGFPSWSWAGWMEDVSTTVTSPYDTDCEAWWADVYTSPSVSPKTTDWARKEVAWHIINEEGTNWVEVASECISHEGSAFYAESLSRWAALDQSPLQEAKQHFSQANLPLSHALGVWTQTITLPVDRDEDLSRDWKSLTGAKPSAPFLGVRDKEGKYVAYICMSDEYRQSQPDELRFMLMGSHRRWEATHGPIMDILHIETTDGITKRVQGVRECSLTLDRWNGMAPEWELIIMA